MFAGLMTNHWAELHHGSHPSRTGNDADSRPAILTSGGANAKGTAVELFASTPVDFGGIYVGHMKSNGTGFTLLDIMIGSTLAEVLIADLPSVNASSTQRLHGFGVYLPIYIPAGSRLGARLQCSTATRQADVQVIGVATMPRWIAPFKRCITVGTVSASSRGTLLGMGAAINQMPASYTQITASLVENIAVGYVFLTKGGSGTGTVDVDSITEIAYGAGGSEVSMMRLCDALETGAETIRPNVWGPFPFGLPAGERLSGRTQSSAITAGVGDRAVTILGFS